MITQEEADKIWNTASPILSKTDPFVSYKIVYLDMGSPGVTTYAEDYIDASLKESKSILANFEEFHNVILDSFKQILS